MLRNARTAYLPRPMELSLLRFSVHFKPEADNFFSAESLVWEWPDFQLSVGRDMGPETSRKATLRFISLKRLKTNPAGQRHLQGSLRMILLPSLFVVTEKGSLSGRLSESRQVRKHLVSVLGTF